MPSKYQYYREMMEHEVPRLTEYSGKWTSFLDTAGRMYKYRFEDQVMIFLQRPDAQACAEYGIWNEVMHRYVLRGSKGIALFDNSGNSPKLRYVFDITNTGGSRNARRPYLWQYQEHLHDRAVGDALAQSFGIPNEYGLSDQTERIMVDLAENYTRDHIAQIRDIFDETETSRYDGLRNEITFKQAVSISASYLVISRCGLDSSHILPEEFDSVRQFRTMEQVNVLGNAVSQLSELVLRQIERTIKSYEREHRAERSQNHGTDLHQTGRLSPARSGPPSLAGGAPEQVREDAQDLSAGAESGPVQHSGDAGGAVPPPVSDQPTVGADAGGPDESPSGEEPSPEPDEESHGLGEAHEQPETAGGGDDPSGVGLQLSPAPVTEQFSFFLTEEEQRQYIEEAERTPVVSSAFTLPQEDIDHILRLGSNSENARMVLATEFSKPKSTEELVDFVKKTYHGGYGLVTDRGNISAWYAEDGIHLTRSNTARYARTAQILSWEDTVNRIATLLETGQFASNVELHEAPGYERRKTAESIWYMHRDMATEVRKQYLTIIPSIRGGFPEETAYLAAELEKPEFLAAITAEMAVFRDAWQEDRSLMRFRFYNPERLHQQLTELAFPRKTFHTDMIEVPVVPGFITEDEIQAALTRGGIEHTPNKRIYDYFTQPHTPKEKADYLKHLYGIGGGNNAISGNFRSHEYRDGKGLRYQKPGCEDVLLKWPRVAKYIDDLISAGRYFTAEQLEELQAQQSAGHAPSEPEVQDTPAESVPELPDESPVMENKENPEPEPEPILAPEDGESPGIYDFEHPWSLDAPDPVPDPVPDLTDEEFASKYLHPGETTFDMDGRTFMVDRITPGFTHVNFQDITFTNETGFPIFRTEPIGFIRRVFEQMEQEPEDRLEDLPRNFRITDDHLGEGGPKSKFKANVEAIRLLKTLEESGRSANPFEQEALSRYVGWGGLADAFDATKDNWATEYAQLKELLTDEEYSAARASTLNAHYTSPTVIRAMYDALEQLGFNGGNILEPAMGIGNFFGCLPDSMADSRLYGVELDSISGRIAGQLYPKADITVAGFETTDRRDFYDLAVGNVPFGQYQVNDRAYNKHGFSIHNYFLAKAVDQVRPGGIVAFLTSRYTMDAKNSDARRYIAQRAELLGAVRLPNDAFKANAGTEVVSDILFFQKREHPIDIEPDWVHLDTTEDGYTMNSYFVEHPEMILGQLAMETTQYGREDLTVNSIEGANLGDQIRQATAHFTAVYREAEVTLDEQEVAETIPALPGVRNYSYAVVDDEVYYRENSVMRKEEVNAIGKERIRGMVALRDTLQELIRLQMEDYPDAQIFAQKEKLNTVYDAFAEKHGRINDKANGRVFSSDSSYYLLCSLENIDDEGQFRGKADIFSKRTIRPDRKVDRVDTATEALAVSIGEHGKVDLPFMAQLLGTPGEYDSIIESLKGIIFKDPLSPSDPEAGWQTADEYLSGNVREKLRIAEMSAKSDSRFTLNVEYLQKAQPKDLEASEIDVRLGATWIPAHHIQDFMYETFQTNYWQRRNIKLNYSQYTGEWQITGKTQPSAHDVAAYVTYGTDRANAYKILEETLNLKAVQIFDSVEGPDGKEKRVLNKKETTLAQQKQQAIKDAFADWIWKSPSRRDELVALYNERFNSVRPREYDGSHLQFVGMNPEISLRPHQLGAIAHVIYGGNTLLAHEVGAGKTFEMIASAMESKRLGLCQKSMFVVPNHLTLQWANEFLRLYPSAKILVTSAKDFETSRRKKFCSRIATGDYDAVIIGHSQFERIPISPERQERLLEQQLNDIQIGIDELARSWGNQFSIKQLEKTKRSIKARLEKVQGMDRKDDVIYFEQLGIDRLFVDESQAYKNLFLYTKMRNIAGLSTSEAQRSSDMFNKCRYLDEVTGGRGVVFASGTPVSNSMTELYTVMRYLQYDTLQRTGLGHFDAWASTFGETTTAIELAPEGTGYRARTRFAKFFNLPELMTMFKEVADIKTSDQLNLPVPEAKFETVVVQPSEFQKDMVASLSERAALVHAGAVDPSEDNMLKITSDGRKIGLDQRLMNPMLPDDPGSKLNACVANIIRIYQEGTDDRLTQLVFCDMSTPKNDDKFNVYDDIKRKLMDAGIPEAEIAFIHTADTEKKKKDLFGKVNDGKVRILLGSTQKMGAGTNVQQRLIALHHLDVGWRPSDMTQRNGRIIRQGNRNKQVQVYQYVTEGTFDAYLYQTLENKQKFIGQIMTSRSPVRSCDDMDEQALSYAEIKALCAGNPLIKEKMDLDIEVSRLKVLRSAHRSQQFHLEDQLLKIFPKEIQEAVERVEGFQKDLATAQANPVPEDSFPSMELIGRTITDKEEAGKIILALCQTAGSGDPKPIGHYRGFDLDLQFSSFHQAFSITIRGAMRHQVTLGNDIRGNITRLDNGIANILKRLLSAQEHLTNLRAQQEATKAQLGKPFPQEAEYQAKSKRLAELDTLLNMDGSSREKPSVIDALHEPPPRRTKPPKRESQEESL